MQFLDKFCSSQFTLLLKSFNILSIFNESLNHQFMLFVCIYSVVIRLVTSHINRKGDTILDKTLLKSGPYGGYLTLCCLIA